MLRGFLAALAAMFACWPAAASFHCSSGCDITPETSVQFFNWDIPDDGVTYLLKFTTTDPNARIQVGEPQVPTVNIQTRDGHPVSDFIPDIFFRETMLPGIATVFVRSPKSFDHCDQPGPADAICAISYDWFFNDSLLIVMDFGSETKLFGTVTAVPEPTTWAFMLAGFGLAGAVTRRRRSVSWVKA